MRANQVQPPWQSTIHVPGNESVDRKSAINSFAGIAALTGLASLLMLAASVLPTLSILFYFFLKAPLILISLGNGFRIGLLALGAIAALVIPFSHGDYNLPYLIEYGAVAMIMAEALRRKMSFNRIVILCAAVSVSIALISMALNPPLGADSLLEVPARLVAQMRGDAGQLSSQGGVDPRHLKGMGHFIALMEVVISRAFPALLITGAALGALLNYLTANKLSRGFAGLGSFNPGALSTWAASEHYVWFFIIGGTMAVVPFGVSRTLGVNLVVIMLFVYFLQGLAITGFFFKKWNLSILLRVPVYIFIFFNVYLALLVACVGLFDTWADFRKIRKTAEDKRS